MLHAAFGSSYNAGLSRLSAKEKYGEKKGQRAVRIELTDAVKSAPAPAHVPGRREQVCPPGGCGKIPLRCPAPLRGRSAARAVPVQSFAPLSARCVRLLVAVSSAPIPPNAHSVVIDDTFPNPYNLRCTAWHLRFRQPAKEFRCGYIQKRACGLTKSRF